LSLTNYIEVFGPEALAIAARSIASSFGHPSPCAVQGAGLAVGAAWEAVRSIGGLACCPIVLAFHGHNKELCDHAGAIVAGGVARHCHLPCCLTVNWARCFIGAVAHAFITMSGLTLSPVVLGLNFNAEAVQDEASAIVA
jgi:hypothetical protein